MIFTSLAPGLRAVVASTRYGACHTMPSDLPFTVTSARFFTLAQVNPDMRAVLEPIRTCVDGLGVGSRSREILHAGVLVFAPRRERIERDRRRSASAGLEAYGPRTFHRGKLRLCLLWRGERSFPGRLAEDNEHRAPWLEFQWNSGAAVRDCVSRRLRAYHSRRAKAREPCPLRGKWHRQSLRCRCDCRRSKDRHPQFCGEQIPGEFRASGFV